MSNVALIQNDELNAVVGGCAPCGCGGFGGFGGFNPLGLVGEVVGLHVAITEAALGTAAGLVGCVGGEAEGLLGGFGGFGGCGAPAPSFGFGWC